MTLHKEGTIIILVSSVFLLLLNYMVVSYLTDWPILSIFITLASIVFFIIILQFFRKPNRKIKIRENAIYAPADGKVVVIEETKESEYFQDSRIQVSIFMSPFNVHINYNPISGLVKYFKYHPGKYLVAWHPKSSTENERTTFVVQHNNGQKILFRQIAGALARRIRWYANEGEFVKQGEEFGFIKFGSRIDVFLPLNAKIKVNLEDKTVGGQTLIAEI